MAVVVGHDLDFYPKASKGTGERHEVLLWEKLANGTRRMVASGHGTSQADAFNDLLQGLRDDGVAEQLIRRVRASYANHSPVPR